MTTPTTSSPKHPKKLKLAIGIAILIVIIVAIAAMFVLKNDTETSISSKNRKLNQSKLVTTGMSAPATLSTNRMFVNCMASKTLSDMKYTNSSWTLPVISHTLLLSQNANMVAM